jgi:hypothetical protein
MKNIEKPEQPDWAAAESAYCASAEAEAQIARRLGIGRTALRGRAAREGWQRPEPVRRGPLPKPPRPVESSATYSSAEQYLLAVVCGSEPPDPVRVGAARALLPFQERPKRRALPASQTPAEQARQEALAETSAADDEWSEIVKQTRAEFAKRNKNPEGN